MKRPSNAPLNRQILEEASDWFVDFRAGDIDASARARFDEWLRRSPEHIRAYWEIAKTYVELPALAPAAKLDVPELIARAQTDANVVSLLQMQERESPTFQATDRDRMQPRKSRELQWRRRLLVAASVVCAVAIAGTDYWRSQRYPTFATDIGERRSITLADGSTVDLNARSKVRVEFSGDERRVELLDGQALFQVTKDSHRPFIVLSGDATVRAVGTQFDVYRKDNGTTVTVLEGRVAVYSIPSDPAPGARASPSPGDTNERPQSPPGPPAQAEQSPVRRRNELPPTPPLAPGLANPAARGAIFLSAGEQVTVTADAVLAPHPIDAATATAWMQRQLVFDGSRLSEVVAEFNRYNRTQLVIEDPQLRNILISGVYSSTDPTSLLRFLRDQGLGVSEGDNQVQIGAPSSKSAIRR